LTFVAALLLFAASSASAQSTDPYFSTLSASYDLVYHQHSDVSDLGAHFDGAVTVKRDAPIIGVAGEVGVNHFAGATVSSYLAGARLRIPAGDERFLPFVQVLLGLYHCGTCKENDFAVQVGGGLDIRIPDKNFRFRTQFDVRHVYADVIGFDAVRLTGGIVFPLNKRE
jgi:hypothetical protein